MNTKNWKLKDVLLIAICAVLFGVVYLGCTYVGGILYGVLTPMGMASLGYEPFYGIYFMAGAFGIYVMRKPGTGLIAELLAAVLECLYGNYFGPIIILSGLVQGLGFELIIALKGERSGTLAVNGYAYPFIPRTLLHAVLPYMTYLTPFTYGITAEGGLVIPDDAWLVAAAAEYRAQPWMHLSTLTEAGSFDSRLGGALLENKAAQARLIDAIVANMTAKGYRGLDVDFEYLEGRQAAAYAAFIEALRQRLDPLGWPVTVALAPKSGAGQKGLLYEGHDYAALGRAADSVLLMTYEWGYTAGPPMAVAPLPQVRRVLDYALTEIPPEKIFLGVPTYGYDWPLPFRQGITRAPSLSPQQALALARRYGAEIQYDETAQAPWFRYTAENGTAHEVWFEDARSSLAKFRLAADNRLQGVGLWSLMRDAPQTYLVLHSAFGIEKAE